MSAPGRVAAAFFSVLVAVQAASAATDAATADALLRDSGLWQQLGDVVEQVQAEFDQAVAESDTRPERADAERFERLIAAAYAPARLRAIAREVVEKQTDDSHVPPLKDWFASKDGKAITRVESDTPNTPEGLQKLRKDGAELLEQMPTSRRDLLEDIRIASRSTEIMTTISIRSTLAVLVALRRANPKLAIPSEFELRAKLEAGRPRMEAALSASFLQMYASIYRKIPDAQLQRYEALLAGQAGRHFSDVLAKAIEAAMVDAANHLGQDLFPPEKGAST